jgi:peroxiredoxin
MQRAAVSGASRARYSPRVRRAGFTLLLWIAGLACGVGGDAEQSQTARATGTSSTASARAPAADAAADRRRTPPLPAFEGRDLDGAPWSTSNWLGKRTVIFGFEPTRPSAAVVARALAAIAAERGPQNFEVVGVASGADAAAARRLLTETGLAVRTLHDPPGALGQRLGVREPVWLIVADPEGRLAFGTEYFPEEGPEPARVVEQMLRAELRLPGRSDASLSALPSAPEFDAERLDGGERFALASLRGKPAILVFFLHTCPHCHEALRFLKAALAALPEERRPGLVGVSIANRTWSVQEALKEEGLDFFPVLLDADASIRTAYGALQGVPVVFLLDAEGRIVSRTDGWSGERDAALLKMRLAKLAGQPVPMLLHTTGYSGNEVCAVCHEAETATWELTNHATAFDTLVRHGADGRAECVSCHVVGYDRAGGYQIAKPDPALEGVGCETCHGRGGPHLSPEFAKPASYEKSCLGCHNPEHSLGFEYASFLPRVSHEANRVHLALPAAERAKLLADRRAPRANVLASNAAYVGSAVCQSCHADEHARWSEQPHARAFATLEAKGKASDGECLRCHTTGLDKPGGYRAGGGPQPALAGVGCESCHGPGGEHVRDGAQRKGTILRLSDKCGSCAIVQICGSCHDAANDPGFEFDVIDSVLRQRHGKEKLDIDGGRSAGVPTSAMLGLLERAFAEPPG